MSESETSQPIEDLTTPESIHDDFMDTQNKSLKQRFTNILGKAAIGMGVTFAIVGIGDFITDGKVSELVASTGLPLTENLANMPQLIKLAGGSSLIAIGSSLE